MHNGLAYAAAGSDVHIVDVSDPRQLRILGRVEGAVDEVRAVASSGDWLYIRGSTSLAAVDVADLDRPIVVDKLPVHSHGDNIVLDGQHLYTTKLSAVVRFDITAGIPSSGVDLPVSVVSSTLTAHAGAVYIAGSTGVFGSTGVRRVDIATVDEPRLTGGIDGIGGRVRAIAGYDNKIYVATISGLWIVELCPGGLAVGTSCGSGAQCASGACWGGPAPDDPQCFLLSRYCVRECIGDDPCADVGPSSRCDRASGYCVPSSRSVLCQ